MALKIERSAAEAVLRAEAAAAGRGDAAYDRWCERVRRLSVLCDEGGGATHIAFLGTSMLAKSVDRRADLAAIKPDHAPNNSRAYSARTLCHSVLVPLAAELGFSIGVTGREPLNNQPYFRMTHLGDGTPVHTGSKAAFDYMCGLVEELGALPTEVEARKALRAFIAVRRTYRVTYSAAGTAVSIAPGRLADAISTFVGQSSEGGKRAQAVVAGLMDVVAGSDRVESGRVNDPSRRHPGDVCVRALSGEGWEKAIEVRDKPVSASDIRIFAQKCLSMGVRDAAVVAVAPGQARLEETALNAWAHEMGVGLTLFLSWRAFTDQALFWAPDSKPVAATRAGETIRQRLIGVEASSDAVSAWTQSLLSQK